MKGRMTNAATRNGRETEGRDAPPHAQPHGPSRAIDRSPRCQRTPGPRMNEGGLEGARISGGAEGEGVRRSESGLREAGLRRATGEGGRGRGRGWRRG